MLFLAESRAKGMRNADVQIDGVVWEIKSPTGIAKRSVEKQFRRASEQSANLIIDGRRSQIPTKEFRKLVMKQ